MFRIKIIIIVLLLNPGISYAAKILSGGIVTRSYQGASGGNVNYSPGLSFSLYQNRFLAYTSESFELWSGIDFDYHSAENDDSKMKFYQWGASGVLSLEKYFAGIGYRFFHPFIPFHAGYAYTVNDTSLENIGNGSHANLFSGAGAGFAVYMGDVWGTRLIYLLDAHFMKGGVVENHGVSLSFFYRI